MYPVSECKVSKGGCGAPILWAVTVNDKAIPLDYEPNHSGNQVITGQGTYHGDAVPLVRTLTKAERAPSLLDDQFPVRYMPHHATCPRWAREKETDGSDQDPSGGPAGEVGSVEPSAFPRLPPRRPEL
jgi:hypothetical protein